MKGNVAAGSGNLDVETKLFYFRSLAMKTIFKDHLIRSFHSDLPGDNRGRHQTGSGSPQNPWGFFEQSCE